MRSLPSSGYARTNSTTTGIVTNKLPVLSIYNQYPVYLAEDWNSGIGGGLWSTGLAMANYFCSPHFQTQLRRIRQQKRRFTTTDGAIRVLELGSGNGFLSVCLVVAAMMQQDNTSERDIKESSSFMTIDKDAIPLYATATDTAEHLSLMKTTIESNLKRISSEATRQHGASLDLSQYITVEEYLWGETTTASNLAPPTGFDLIIGSDLAYRDELHDPLIAALAHFYGNVSTRDGPIILLGVTMTDTKPIFFQKLVQSKFRYEKIADHLMQPEFRGSGMRQFGIFAIYR
jgi:Lysine methyltransferase